MKQKFVTLGLIIAVIFTGAWSLQALRSEQSQEKAPVLIHLDTNGFSPKEVRIKPGVLVRWINTSGAPQTVNSDNYPTNQLHKELNFGIFNNGSSFVHVFTTQGQYKYHNQFHPKQQGAVIVE